MNMNTDQLITALCDSSVYDHEVGEITVIETHISWVILTGEYAYKIKKPIKFSFVDFSTLKKRKFYCNEELRLNGRLAPNLYLGIITITGSSEHPSLDKSKEAIEYAVKMRQFPQTSLLSNLSIHNKLSKKHIDEMARKISGFHMRIDKALTSAVLGTPEDIHHWVTDNYKQMESNITDTKTYQTLKRIQSWSENEYNEKYDQLRERRENGFVRECHGDMHLNNMVLIDDEITIFDGIEFNEHLRWIDVISEVAFLAMDLCDRGHLKYANRFMNLYLQYTGDYEGLSIFKFYLVYRAIVRAKVALLRIAQKNISDIEEESIQKEFISYLSLTSRYISDKKIALIITHGLSGSGKSTYSGSLLETIGAICIRSDVERKRLYGYSASSKTQSNLNEGIYASKSSKATYTRLAELSRSILTSEFTVIVDACFLQHEQRQEFYRLALELNVPFIILAFQASEDCLKKRITIRANNKLEASEADLEVLNNQLNNTLSLDKQEEKNTIVVNTEEEVQIDELAKTIQDRLNELSA